MQGCCQLWLSLRTVADGRVSGGGGGEGNDEDRGTVQGVGREGGRRRAAHLQTGIMESRLQMAPFFLFFFCTDRSR